MPLAVDPSVLVPAYNVRLGHPHHEHVIHILASFRSADPLNCNGVICGATVAVVASLVRVLLDVLSTPGDGIALQPTVPPATPSASTP